MKATKKQINDFLKSHNLQADDLLAHDALRIITGRRTKWHINHVKEF